MKETNMRVEKLSIEQVHPNEWNPNRMSPKTKEVLRRNLEKYGYRQPILVRPDTERGGYEIVDGEHRYWQLVEGGIKEAEFVITDLTTEDAMISTISMNNVRGDADPIAMARMISDLNQRGVTFDELSDLTNYSKDDLEGFNELNLPPEEEELQGSNVTEGVPPIEVTVLLMQGAGEVWHEAMQRAMDIMSKQDAIPLVAEQARAWDEAMRKGHRLSGAKMRSKALEFILKAFVNLPEAATLESIPTIPDGEPSLDELLEQSSQDSQEPNAETKKGRKKKAEKAQEPLEDSGAGDIVDERLNEL